MPWLMGCLLFLLTAGFAKISTVVVNQLLSRPQPKWMMGLTELIQLASLPLYLYIVYDALLGSRAGRVFDFQVNDAVTQLARALIIFGAIGIVELIRSTIVFQCYRSPECEIDVDSRIIDFRLVELDQPWQETLAGPRPMRPIALLPGNEQFTLEVSTKTYLLPRVPREWDGLSIVHLADTHFLGAVACKYFEMVCEQAAALKPDLFVFSGDLLDDPDLLHWLPETFGRLKAPLGQYFVLGNHDWYHDTKTIRREFEAHGWIDLSGRSLELESLTDGPPILLAGDESPWIGDHPMLPAHSRDQFRILLSHTPDNITWARSQAFDVVFAGHTHGGQIRLPILGPVYSPSRFGCKFASGVFWLDPTLLYVSRGLSGREPIRYFCVPELTKIVLRTRSFGNDVS